MVNLPKFGSFPTSSVQRQQNRQRNKSETRERERERERERKRERERERERERARWCRQPMAKFEQQIHKTRYTFFTQH